MAGIVVPTMFLLVIMTIGSYNRYYLEVSSQFDVFRIQWGFALPMLPIGMVVYYRAWKYFVGFLNDEMGIA